MNIESIHKLFYQFADKIDINLLNNAPCIIKYEGFQTQLDIGTEKQEFHSKELIPIYKYLLLEGFSMPVTSNPNMTIMHPILFTCGQMQLYEFASFILDKKRSDKKTLLLEQVSLNNVKNEFPTGKTGIELEFAVPFLVNTFNIGDKIFVRAAFYGPSVVIKSTPDGYAKGVNSSNIGFKLPYGSTSNSK